MATSLAPDTSIQPLTREAFGFPGPVQPIVGCISPFSHGYHGYAGCCLITDGGRDHYSHPTLFLRPSFADRTGGWVRIVFDPAIETLVMRPCRLDGKPYGDETMSAPPAKTAQVSLDLVLEFLSIIKEQVTCGNPGCQGARERPLRPERSVFYVNRNHEMAVACRRCVREMQAADPGAVLKVLLHGSQLPAHAPVTVFVHPAA